MTGSPAGIITCGDAILTINAGGRHQQQYATTKIISHRIVFHKKYRVFRHQKSNPGIGVMHRISFFRRLTEKISIGKNSDAIDQILASYLGIMHDGRKCLTKFSVTTSQGK
jgi:hypothetical protein